MSLQRNIAAEYDFFNGLLSVSGPACAGKVEFMSLGHCDGVFVVSETESDLFSVTGFGK